MVGEVKMADRLISADALKHYILTKGFYCDTEADRQHSAELVDEVFPTIEPKHGWWIEEGLVDGNQNRYCRCSVCGKGDTQAISQRVPYCWWCGAKMDEVEE